MRFPILLTVIALAFAGAAPVHAQSEGLPHADGIVAHTEDFSGPLGEDGFPELPNLLSPNSFTATYRVPAGMEPPSGKNSVPTKIEYSDGSVKWDLNTSLKPNTATPGILPPSFDPVAQGGAAGGSGEVKGNIRYVGREWELYGTQSFGVMQGGIAPPTPYDSTVVGSFYKLPEAMAGGKLGASVEFTPFDERKTRLEYRRPVGPAEGFIAAEQTYPAHGNGHDLPAAVRAGLNRKF